MSGLSKLGTALIIIFVISLVALFAELFYVQWRRRIFHRQSQSPPLATMQGGGAADSNSRTFSDTSSSSFSSKELLYFFFFCHNSGRISRVEPTSSIQPSVMNSAEPCPEEETEEVIDVFKLQNMYGPSRFLFTIKEEERENDVESDKDKSLCSSAEKGTANKHNTSKRVNLEDCFKAADYESTPQVEVEVEVEVEAEVAVAVAVIDDHVSGNAITPFSTPCESPLYFTPSSSPTRELIDGVQTGNVPGNGQTMSSVRVEL